MFKRIDHVEIIPTDFEKTVAFYTKVLGFKVGARKTINRPPLKEVLYIKLGDTVIEMLSVDKPLPPAKNFWQAGYARIALEVENMDEAIKYLTSKGIKITVPPVNLGDSLRGEIADPDGLSVELRQWFK